MTDNTTKNDNVQPAPKLRGLTDEEKLLSDLLPEPLRIKLTDEHMNGDDILSKICQVCYQSVHEIVNVNPQAAAEPDSETYRKLLREAVVKRGISELEYKTFLDNMYDGIVPQPLPEIDLVNIAKEIHAAAAKRRNDRLLDAAGDILIDYRKGEATAEAVAEAMRTTSEALQADGERAKDGDGFAFIRADEIPGSPDTEWLLDAFIPKCGIVLLAGSPKGGKTTFTRLMLKACGEGGGFIGRRIEPMRVLVVTEESPRLWKRFVSEIGIGNHVSFLFQPFRAKPTLVEFTKLVDAICREIKASEIDIVILDTWSHLSPSADEDDAMNTEASLAPLRRIPEVGAGLLMLHHTRKSGGDHGSAIRGSSALAGFPDVNLEISRMPGDAGDDTRRTLRATSRYEETPTEIVIEKRGNDYVEVGTTAEARQLDDISVIRKILIAGPEDGMKQNEIKEAWPDDDHAPKRPCDTALFNLLKSGAERAVPIWNKSGTGHRGDAVRYSFIHLKRGIVNESIGKNGSKDSFIQNLSLRVNESINGESDLYGSKNGHTRISQPETLKTTTDGVHRSGFTDAYSGDDYPF